MRFLNMDEFVKNLTPITSTEYLTKTGEFNPEGLFSEEIFGPVGSNERRKTFSYINLYCRVIHPDAFRILKQLDRKIEYFISTEHSYTIDENGSLILNDENGISGIESFIENFEKIKFRGGGQRDKLIESVTKSYNDGSMIIEYIPVVPPDIRPMYQGDDGEWIIDEFNDIYISLLRKSFQIMNAGSGPLFDLLNYEMHNTVMKHDNYVRSKLGKKEGAIRGLTLGKRTDYTARAVITPGPDLKPKEVGIPFRMAVKLFEPFIIHILMKTNKIDQDQLSEEIQNYLQMEINVDSVQKVIKSIKNGDKIPEGLYNIFWEATEMAMENRAVICKRDPVLHQQSVQGYKPKLVNGSTIQVSTVSVGGHNADFDGDSILCDVIILNENKFVKYNLSELQYKRNLFEKYRTKVKGNTTIENYRPTADLKIQSINSTTGGVSFNRITEYSVHKNLDMFKISNKNFKDFWCSSDHSLIIYDENENRIRKASPLELKENPRNKYLLKGEKP